MNEETEDEWTIAIKNNMAESYRDGNFDDVKNHISAYIRYVGLNK